MYVKIVFLVALLAGVIYAMSHVNEESMAKFLGAFGIQSASSDLHAATRPTSAGESRLNICPARIHEVVWPDGRKIAEITDANGRLEWKSYSPVERPISTIDVEKWLSQHCQVVVTPTPGANFKEDHRIVLKYADGNELVLEREGNYGLRMTGQVYQSEDLVKALIELETLADFPRSQGQ